SRQILRHSARAPSSLVDHVMPSRAGLSLRRALPRIADRELFLLAAVLGMIGGLAEAVHVVVSYWVFPISAGQWVTGEIYWMAPLAACVTLGVCAGACVALRRVFRADETANGLALFALSGLCVFSFGRAIRAGIHPAA